MMQKTNWRAIALAFIGFLALGTAAFALNVPSSSNFSARLNRTQQTNYFRFTINWNDANIKNGVKFGRMPASAFVTSVKCHVTTAFNAGTTNVVTVGYETQATNQLINASDLNEASATYQNLTSAAGLGLAMTSGGEQDLYAKYTQTGTAATAGAVTCIAEYVPNNDN